MGFHSITISGSHSLYTKFIDWLTGNLLYRLHLWTCHWSTCVTLTSQFMSYQPATVNLLLAGEKISLRLLSYKSWMLVFVWRERLTPITLNTLVFVCSERMTWRAPITHNLSLWWILNDVIEFNTKYSPLWDSLDTKTGPLQYLPQNFTWLITRQHSLLTQHPCLCNNTFKQHFQKNPEAEWSLK